MIGYRYFRGDFRVICVVCASLPSLVSAGPPRGFDYTPRFVLFGVGSCSSRVRGETRLEIASLHTLRKGK